MNRRHEIAVGAFMQPITPENLRSQKIRKGPSRPRRPTRPGLPHRVAGSRSTLSPQSCRAQPALPQAPAARRRGERLSIAIQTIGQLAKMPGWSLERVLGRAAGEKLTALAWNRDPREIKHRRAQSAGAQSALGRKPAEEQVFRPALRHLADRVATRLRAKSRPGRTVTIRVRFADLHSVTRSITLDAPISATAILAEIAEELVRTALADHPTERTISLLAISVAHLESHWDVQLELPLGLEDEDRRPGTKRGMARWTVDRAVDKIRDRFGWEAVEYGAALGLSRSVPDEFRELAEKDL
jgi:DNA polymerase IV